MESRRELSVATNNEEDTTDNVYKYHWKNLDIFM